MVERGLGQPISGCPGREIINGKRARGSGPGPGVVAGPGVVIGPGRRRYGLPGLGQGDGEAEALDLPEVVAERAVDIEAGYLRGDQARRLRLHVGEV